MAWEERRGRRYYYRSERDGDRVRKRYLGRGELAAVTARLDDLERTRVAAEQARERAERQHWAALDEQAADFSAAVDRLLTVTLEAAGYHRHHRGEWRKHRHETTREAE